METHLNQENSSLNQKYELKEKLKKILKEIIETEVIQQAEGILAPPDRDKAKNLARTESKLERVIQKQEDSYLNKRIQFCEKCPHEKMDIKRYCSFCAEKSECNNK